MTIEQALKQARAVFRDAGIDDPAIESEFLMASVLGQSRAHVLLARRERLNLAAEQKFDAWVKERRARKPLAYITGEQPFYGQSFKVTPEVLIPRPETELLVEEAWKRLDEAPPDASVTDVGTGSGAIAISLAAHPRVARVLGIDVSAGALRIAAENAAARSAARCQWRQADLLSTTHETFFMVVANLPYVRSDEMSALARELHWEPRVALEGGADGLDAVYRLVDQSFTRVDANGYVLLEIGATQAEAVARRVRARGWGDVTVFKDLAGHDRFVRARKDVSWIS